MIRKLASVTGAILLAAVALFAGGLAAVALGAGSAGRFTAAVTAVAVFAVPLLLWPHRPYWSPLAADRYEQARRALDENSLADYAAGVDEETDEFHRLNHAVIEAERGVSWWRRWRIDSRVTRELDYWARMDEITKRRKADGRTRTGA